MSDGWRVAWVRAARIEWAARRGAGIVLREPMKDPIGVRLAATITTSRGRKAKFLEIERIILLLRLWMGFYFFGKI